MAETKALVAESPVETIDLSKLTPEPKCGSCKCFHPQKDGKGDCRHAPPIAQIFFVPDIANRPTPMVQSAWPIVKSDQFCITGYVPRLQ